VDDKQPQVPIIAVTFVAPATPMVNIVGVSPFQIIIAIALLTRIADKAMTDLENSLSKPPSPIVVVRRGES
jgi:hypothetical protein